MRGAIAKGGERERWFARETNSTAEKPGVHTQKKRRPSLTPSGGAL